MDTRRGFPPSRLRRSAVGAEGARYAAADGLDFRFDLARGSNTFDAHRIVHLPAARGAQDAVKERVMHAYPTEGELISDHATLARLAVESLPSDSNR